MTRSARSSDLWRILLNRIPLTELQATRINPLQVQRQTEVYDLILSWFEGLLDSRATVEAARQYLIRTGSVSKILDLPYYEYFSGLVSNYLRVNP